MKPHGMKGSRDRYSARRRAKALQSLCAVPQPTAPGLDPALLAELELKLQGSVQEGVQQREALARQRAEFDNFRRRTMKEKEQIRDAAREDVIAKILPVLDNFERALASTESATDAKPIRDGITMVSGQLMRLLEAEGLKPIETMNAPFDPNEHEALATEERTDVEENHVCEEMLRGYRFKEKVIRAAMVKVAKAPAEKAQA
ncbi:MAG: nucleotide exchange factor GrpE [Candidatus Sumerlaeaceae bacterium]